MGRRFSGFGAGGHRLLSSQATLHFAGQMAQPAPLWFYGAGALYAQLFL